jgi:Cu(I)/Ag(I) efflux system membrane protein CusA/SilA
MISSKGYLKNVEDIENIPVSLNKETGSPILLRDIAKVRIGPQMRRGIAELDGEGEVVGGIVVMRYGENALQVIKDIKAKIEELKAGLPEGVEIVTTYDRSKLILSAVDNLKIKLLEEFAVVAIVCLLFLFHLRSALVAIISLPIGILMAFIVMHNQGINANIMSLGGIAIAIGAMIDAAIVMIENVHKHLEHYKEDHGVMPKGKAKIVSELQQKGQIVCFIGDGINDSIAIKQADVSISLKGASTIAQDLAQVILISNSLKSLCRLFEIAISLDVNLKLPICE